MAEVIEVEDKEWLMNTARGDIEGYVVGRKEKITLKWVRGHLNWLMRWDLTSADIRCVISQVEQDSISSFERSLRFQYLAPERRRRLETLVANLQKARMM